MIIDRPEFTSEQLDFLMSAIDWWYLSWKGMMTDNHDPHYLGVAKEQLKQFIAEGKVDKSLEMLLRQSGSNLIKDEDK